jgi:formamidopyrimidine-DNA glycosylase
VRQASSADEIGMLVVDSVVPRGPANNHLEPGSVVNANDEWPSKFSKVYVELDDGIEMSFTDKRRLARVRLLENPEVVPPISELGPDALLELFPEEDLINRLSKKKIAIKGLLLDQSFIAGIGNWIADEVLYQARIHPMQPAYALSKESCKYLHKCIKEEKRSMLLL